MKNLVRRASSGTLASLIVLAWMILADLFAQPWAVALLLALVALGASLEYSGMVRTRSAQSPRGDRSLAALSVLVIGGYALPGGAYGPLVLAAAVGWIVLRGLPRSAAPDSLSNGLLGILYIPYPLHFFYLIYLAPGGLGYAMLLLGLVWAYDSGAYLVGHRWGRHKLFPAISPSPHKSWEGVAGGLLFSLAIGLASRLWIVWPGELGLFLLQAGGLALLTGCVAQLGDLFESKLKRAAGVKDSGTLFPGHGGLLDRIDGLLFAMPLFYGYLHYLLRWL